MKRISEAEQQIRELTNQNDFHKRILGDDWIRLCVAMDTLGDSTEALMHFEECGLGSTAGERYIRLYGTLQAVILQQDAIKEIYKVYVSSELEMHKRSAWKRCRELRNWAVGHPIDADHGKLRVFVSRSMITPDGRFHLLTYQRDKRISSDHIDFPTLYSSYKEEALKVLRETQAKQAALAATL